MNCPGRAVRLVPVAARPLNQKDIHDFPPASVHHPAYLAARTCLHGADNLVAHQTAHYGVSVAEVVASKAIHGGLHLAAPTQRPHRT